MPNSGSKGNAFGEARVDAWAAERDAVLIAALRAEQTAQQPNVTAFAAGALAVEAF